MASRTTRINRKLRESAELRYPDMLDEDAILAEFDEVDFRVEFAQTSRY